MKNRLQKAFSRDVPTDLNGTIKFTDNKHYAEFLKKLDIVHETGKAQKIDGVEMLTMDQNIAGKKYPLAEHSSITELYICPSVDKFEMPVITESGKYIWIFNRTQMKSKIITENADSDIVHIKFEVDVGNEIINLTYKTNPQNAHSVTEIVEAYSATLALFSRIIRKEEEGKLQQATSYFEKSICFFKRIVELEKCFGVAFCPQSMMTTPSDEEKAEKLHLSVVKGYIIRENKGITDFTVDYSDDKPPEDIKVGQEYSFSYLSSFETDVFGISLTINTVNVVFNLIVDSIEDNPSKKKCVIRTKDTDTAPMYIAYKGFSTKEHQKNEMEQLISNYNEGANIYRDAKTFNQLFRDMQNIKCGDAAND